MFRERIKKQGTLKKAPKFSDAARTSTQYDQLQSSILQIENNRYLLNKSIESYKRQNHKLAVRVGELSNKIDRIQDI